MDMNNLTHARPEIPVVPASPTRGESGGIVIDPDLAGHALRAVTNPLTGRERDVLAAAEDGATVADIAARLHLSASTVRNYPSDDIGQTGTRNKTEAALLARRNGWL
jgi:two-component system, NarL family, response regulator DesR